VAIPPALPLSGPLYGDRFGPGEGRWLGNRRADVHSLGSSPLGLGFARRWLTVELGFAEGGHVCLGVVGEAVVSAAPSNNSLWPLPRPGGVLLRRHRQGRRSLYRSPGPVSLRLYQMGVLPVFSFMGAELVVGDVVSRRLDLASSLDGGGRQRWAQI
jgi:hypothetical protein